MTADESFLQAVVESPEADAPRLVYADWLEENGQPERAEFIRIECRLGRLLTEPPRRHVLESRARQLLCITDGVFLYEGNLSPELEGRDRRLVSAHGARWAGPLAGLVKYGGFRRGFVEEVGLGGRQFLANSEDLFRLAPVRHASLSKVPPVLVATLMQAPWLECLRSLDLAHNRIGPRGGRGLGACPYLGGLTALDLTHCGVGDSGLEALLSSPHLDGLRELDLWNNDLSEAGARLLAGSPTLRRLEYLSAGCNPFGEAGERALRERFGRNVTFGLRGVGGGAKVPGR